MTVSTLYTQLRPSASLARISFNSTTNMRFAWFSYLVFAMAVLAADPPTELKIETTFLPEDCTSTAQKGDSLSVHYVFLRVLFIIRNLTVQLDWNSI